MRLKNIAKTFHGNKRIVKKFAWLPVRRNDGQGIWLEHFFELQTYYSGYCGSEWETDAIYFLDEQPPVLEAL